MDNDYVVGPRCGSDARDGAYQYPTLSAGEVIDLSDDVGEYVQVQWTPAEGSQGLLYYGFFATEALATTGFDTASESSGSKVATAPAWIEWGSDEITVPVGRPWLRIEPSAGSGRAAVRNVDDGRSDGRS